LIDGKYRYGGDSGEFLHDGNFCVDGLVFPGRSFKAGSFEARHAYRYVDVLPINVLKGEFEITNRHDFIDLSGYNLTWELEKDGEIINSGIVDCAEIAPHTSATAKIDYGIPETCSLGVHINFSCTLKEDTIFAQKGYETALFQFELPVKTVKKRFEKTSLSLKKEGGVAIISCGEIEYEFDFTKGFISGIKYKGESLLDGRSKLSVWRAPTDNDRKIKLIWGHYQEIGYIGWNLNGLMPKLYSCVVEEGQEIIIKTSGSLGGIARLPAVKYASEYRFCQDGRVVIKTRGEKLGKIDCLPRFGFEFEMPKENDYLKYYAFGPEENYTDMRRHVKIGQYESTVKEQYVPYIKPQEHGNHFGSRELFVGRKSGKGLLFESDGSFEFNVSEFTSEELSQKNHYDELVPSGKTIVRIDYKNAGIGSSSCGPAIMEKYRVNDDIMEYEFSIRPIGE
ncbi:MAG: beta-galactosidase domain 4-containing protein, partial [Monoglobales bacterium]